MELCDLDVYADKCFIKKLNSRCVMVESVIRVEPISKTQNTNTGMTIGIVNVNLILAARKSNVIASGQVTGFLNIKR